MTSITLEYYMEQTTPPIVIRAAKDMFCNIGILARKALFAVGVPKSEVTENKGCVVRNSLDRQRRPNCLNNWTLFFKWFLKLIQKVGKGEIKGMIKKVPALGLNGDINLEGDSENGGDKLDRRSFWRKRQG